MEHEVRGVLMGLFALFFATVPAFAHHGYATEFDATKCIDLKGTLSGVEWENPHAFFHMDVKYFDGKVNTWRLETISPNSLKRSGTTREDVLNNVGKPAVARICPTRRRLGPQAGMNCRRGDRRPSQRMGIPTLLGSIFQTVQEGRSRGLTLSTPPHGGNSIPR